VTSSAVLLPIERERRSGVAGDALFGGANIGVQDVTDNHFGLQQALVRYIPAGREAAAIFIGIRSLGERIRPGNDRGALALRQRVADLARAERVG
jgi:hypothetical protein